MSSRSLAYLLLLLILLLDCVVSQTGLSRRDEREILDSHNHFRGLVIPTASNMERMAWSDGLARVAQDYAEQCIFQHNGERTSQQNTFNYVGENLAITSRPNVNYTDLVRRWFDERKGYNYETNRCIPGAKCGHYTQVVWATSSFVGCGAFRCAKPVGFAHYNSIHLVCNYGPSGNYYGYLPYTSGLPCSQCRRGLNHCIGNLCSPAMENVTFGNNLTTSKQGKEPGILERPLTNNTSGIHEICVLILMTTIALLYYLTDPDYCIELSF